MHLLMFCIAIIVMGILLYNIDFGSQSIISSDGYLYPNPIYSSGNKQQRNKKHNMLRISKIRRK